LQQEARRAFGANAGNQPQLVGSGAHRLASMAASARPPTLTSAARLPNQPPRQEKAHESP
jgi:hypothetical protein